MIMQPPRRFLSLHAAEQSAHAPGNASHGFRVAAEGVLARRGRFRALRTARAHAHSEHRRQDRADLHEEC
eukprot:4795187-Pyramimonas_sp.AAC.1